MQSNRLFKALILVLVSLAWTSCHKDKEINGKDPFVSNEEITVSSFQAHFSWSVDFAGEFHTGVELSQNENMTDVRRIEATKEEDKYVAVVSDLSMGTKYYYRIVVWNKFNNYEEETKSFTTSQTFNVTIACLPEEGGTTSGGGVYIASDTCLVKATANEGYRFVNWMENESQVSTEANYSFVVTSDRNLVAYFTSQEYTITATAEPSEGGTVSGSGGYNNGDECTLTAIPNEGYAFVNWTKDGTEVSTNPVYIFAVTETAVYVARFQVQSYTIMVASNSVEGGSIEGGGIYEYGQNCTVRATEANGFQFVNWTENGEQVSSEEEYTFTVTGNRDLMANFTSQQYTITVSANPTNGGSVTGGGIYYEGEQCTVTATPASNYTFSNWTENDNVVSPNANYTFTVNTNRNLVANFTYNGGNDHAYVDLGLPSGLLWATCNVGADNPEDYGDYFAWGETMTMRTYNWSTYQYCNGSINTLTKYCNNSSYGYNGFTDNQTTLLPEDDAATANWGDGWRMPTKEEFQELLDNTTVTWTTQNGVNGRLFTASNGNSLFLPAAGCRENSSLLNAGSYGYYWSSSLNTDYPYSAWLLYSKSVDYYMYNINRYYGLSVRPVRVESQN